MCLFVLTVIANHYTYSWAFLVAQMVKKVKSLSRVQLFGASWTVAYQAPPSIEFSRQEYWSGLPFPSPGDLPNPGIKPGSPTLRADTLPSEPQPACNSGDLGLIPGLGRSPGEGNSYPLQYSCLENSMERGAWWAPVRPLQYSCLENSTIGGAW